MMDIIGLMIGLFLIGALIALYNVLFGPIPVSPRLLQAAAIIGFVIIVLVILHELGYGPSFRLR